MRPWRSPYVRWRMETFSGVAVAQLTKFTLIRVLWNGKRQLFRFLIWTAEMRKLKEQDDSRRL